METLGSRQAFANPWIAVREDAVRRPDGSTGTYWVVEAGDIALVIPEDGHRLHLVEQYRHPVGRRTWEFPSGDADPGLDGDAAAVAVRELREETGLVAGTLAALGILDITPSTMTQRCTVFLASDLTEQAPQRDPEERDMRSEWFTRTEVEQLMKDGAVTDAKSVAAYGLLLMAG